MLHNRPFQQVTAPSAIDMHKWATVVLFSVIQTGAGLNMQQQTLPLLWGLSW